MTDSGADPIDVAALDAWVHECARVIAANRDHLSELDSATGDADHGANLDRGFAAVVAALAAEPPDSAAELLKLVGMTLVDTIGGSSGALYGTFFLRMAVTARDSHAFDAVALARAVRAGADGVAQRGGVRVGDKTMFDALAPAADALEAGLARGRGRADLLGSAAVAAEAGRDATVPMRARKGRASYLGDRSIGHADAGASSMALIVRAAADTLSGAREQTGGRP